MSDLTPEERPQEPSRPEYGEPWIYNGEKHDNHDHAYMRYYRDLSDWLKRENAEQCLVVASVKAERDRLLEQLESKPLEPKENHKWRFPRADEKQAALGWIFDLEYRNQLERLMPSDDFAPGHEGIECVLQAIEAFAASHYSESPVDRQSPETNGSQS